MELTPTSYVILGMLGARAAVGLRDQAHRRQLDPLLLGGQLRADLPRAAPPRGGRAGRGSEQADRGAAAHRLPAHRRRARGAARAGSASAAAGPEIRDEGLLKLFFRDARPEADGGDRSRRSAPTTAKLAAAAGDRAQGRRGAGELRPARRCATGSSRASSSPTGAPRGRARGRERASSRGGPPDVRPARRTRPATRQAGGDRAPSSSSCSPARSAPASPTGSTPTAPTIPRPRA